MHFHVLDHPSRERNCPADARSDLTRPHRTVLLANGRKQFTVNCGGLAAGKRRSVLLSSCTVADKKPPRRRSDTRRAWPGIFRKSTRTNGHWSGSRPRLEEHAYTCVDVEAVPRAARSPESGDKRARGSNRRHVQFNANSALVSNVVCKDASLSGNGVLLLWKS